MDSGTERPDPLGFPWEGWFERLIEAETDHEFGRLGPYEVLGEVARGGQAVVFRARQPGTGREIALKRLLAGSFATPAALRRFEREVEAATALDHPGIVRVLGSEVADGTPLLAMEWIEGVPLTRWSAGKSNAEILAQFLLVCDAVQHAHQRGVLHRDLKPSNVLVDREEQPRILDFGLAKIARETGSTITASGEFLGTPAYAAPEQWWGDDLDARADVYSLGALLFEMLTRRRVVEGDARAAMARALERQMPPRPSSFVGSIPRELDDIVMQALASEREKRYQSVDALSADLRRFQRREPVLAHPPGTGYLLRKLVARNRVATAFLLALVVATAAYLAAAARNARLLARERDRALAAGENEKLAREAADEQRRNAEAEERRATALREDADRERERAEAAREKAEALLGFLSEDVLGSVDPTLFGRDPKLADILISAAGKAKERFAKAPDAEAEMHFMLGHGLAALGKLQEAERELRAGLSLRDRDTADLARTAPDEVMLGSVLLDLGRVEEAERVLLDVVARFEALPPAAVAVPGVKTQWAKVLNQLARVEHVRHRLDKALELVERAIALTEDPEEVRTMRANTALLLRPLGREDEALAIQQEYLEYKIATKGEDDASVAGARYQLGVSQLFRSDHGRSEAEVRAGLREAEFQLRTALEHQRRIYGEEHATLIDTGALLAQALVELKEFAEAEDLARRGLALCETNSSDGWHAFVANYTLGYVLEHRRRPAEAVELLERALPIAERLQGKGGELWVIIVQALVRNFVSLGDANEAQRYLDLRETVRGRLSRSWFVLWNARVQVLRGELVDAALALEEGIRETDPGSDRLHLRGMLGLYASVLRKLDAPEEALEAERRLADLGGPVNPLEPRQDVPRVVETDGGSERD
jgi:tetratricopeptide (TPR) repeat protein